MHGNDPLLARPGGTGDPSANCQFDGQAVEVLFVGGVEEILHGLGERLVLEVGKPHHARAGSVGMEMDVQHETGFADMVDG